jgi:hypothetical protein
VAKAKAMLLSAEQWRKEKNVDELVRCVFFQLTIQRLVETLPLPSLPSHRTFQFTEKAEVDKYYPQYYHKIDKVRNLLTPLDSEGLALVMIVNFFFRTVVRSTLSNSAN